ncbi:Dynein regulatory complex protein 8 [Nowakowskiella sp. JEL0407]|nr:Dynein regulatory complex protein 8 [Nowakowskiella sp. JEL0407]
MGKKSKTPKKDDPAVDIKPVEKILSEAEKSILLEKIKTAFEVFDQANNQTCDVKDVGSILNSLGVYLTLDQLHTFTKEVTYTPFSHSPPSPMCDPIDPQQIGALSLSAFTPTTLKLLSSSTYTHENEETLYRAFVTLDTEKKGYLTPDELKSVVMNEGDVFSSEEAEEFVLACTDPSEGKVYYEDFVTILAQ